MLNDTYGRSRDRKTIYVSKRTGIEKVRINVMIRKDLYDKLRREVARLFNYNRGALSDAVEWAIELWLATVHSAHYRRINPPSSVEDEFERVLEQIYFDHGEIPHIMPQEWMEKAIMKAFGVHDPRTIYSRLQKYYTYGFIKPLSFDVITTNKWKYNKSIKLIYRSRRLAHT